MCFPVKEKRMMKSILQILILLLTLSSVAHADIVYIDLGAAHPGLPATYAAAAPAPGVWNSITSAGTTTGLVNSSGAPIPINLTITAGLPSGFIGNIPNDNATLLGDNLLSPSSQNWGFSVAGLSNGNYDIYYYEPAHGGVGTGLFDVNGVAATPLSSSDIELVQGETWDVVSVTVDDGTLTLTSTPTPGIAFTGLAGIQIVAVPEPGPLAALWFLGGLVFARRRRHSQ